MYEFYRWWYQNEFRMFALNLKMLLSVQVMDFDGRAFTINSKDINTSTEKLLPKNLIFLVPLLNLIKVIKKLRNIFKLKQKKIRSI